MGNSTLLLLPFLISRKISEERLLTDLKTLFLKYRHFLLLSLLGVTSFLYFLLQTREIVPFSVSCPLDDAIPFLPIFILPYIIWYAYIPLLMLWVGLRDKTAFYRLCTVFFLGNFLCLLLFYFFPTSIPFRPTAEGDGILLRLCRLIFTNDKPLNVCPSLHCYEAVMVHLAAFRCRPLRRHRAARAVSLLLTVLICLSTVFVKQHSVVDVVCGAALAVALYLLFYGVLWRDSHDSQTF